MARNTARGRHASLYCNGRRASLSLSRPPCLVTLLQAARTRRTGCYRPPCPATLLSTSRRALLHSCTLHRLSKMARYYPCFASLSSSAACSAGPAPPLTSAVTHHGMCHASCVKSQHSVNLQNLHSRFTSAQLKCTHNWNSLWPLPIRLPFSTAHYRQTHPCICLDAVLAGLISISISISSSP